jgi:hypothetical protein
MYSKPRLFWAYDNTEPWNEFKILQVIQIHWNGFQRHVTGNVASRKPNAQKAIHMMGISRENLLGDVTHGKSDNSQ